MSRGLVLGVLSWRGVGIRAAALAAGGYVAFKMPAWWVWVWR